MIREHFVAVAVPTQVRGGKSPEAEFIRACGCQWVTSAGYMDVVTASGAHLGGFPSQKILDEFRKLPEESRRPNGGQIADLKPGESAVPTPPENGLILRVHTRAMARDGEGGYRAVTVEDYPLVKGDVAHFDWLKSFGNFGPNVDSMWLTEDEWRALLPAEPVTGERREVDPAVTERLVRFHLVPHKMVGGGGGWSKAHVNKAKLTLIVDEVTKDRVRLRAEGFAHMGSTYDVATATSPNGPLGHGYEAPLHGLLEYDRAKDEFTRFDLIALGDIWGRWGDANGKSMGVERAGRNPILIAFELATGDSPTNRIPPGGWGYYLDLGYFANRE
ncbi:MAG: hypothetical protein WD069_11280 [Planctomycetales bacterium]